MFRSKLFIIFIAITGVLAIYLLTSNMYMYKIFDKTTEKIYKTKIDQYDIKGSIKSYEGVYYFLMERDRNLGMTSIKISGGIYDKGNSFTKNDNGYTLFLLGEKNYKLESYSSFLPFMTRNNDLVGGYNCFSSYFNTFKIDRGIYSLGILNDNNTIIKSTSAKLLINGEQVITIAYNLTETERKELDNITQKEDRDDMRVIVKYTNNDKNLYQIAGNVFLTDQKIDSYNSVLFIKITNQNKKEIYRVPLSYNEWVDKNIGHKSRFSFIFTHVYFEDFENSKIEYYLMNKGKLYYSSKINTTIELEK